MRENANQKNSEYGHFSRTDGQFQTSKEIQNQQCIRFFKLLNRTFNLSNKNFMQIYFIYIVSLLGEITFYL